MFTPRPKPEPVINVLLWPSCLVFQDSLISQDGSHTCFSSMQSAMVPFRKTSFLASQDCFTFQDNPINCHLLSLQGDCCFFSFFGFFPWDFCYQHIYTKLAGFQILSTSGFYYVCDASLPQALSGLKTPPCLKRYMDLHSLIPWHFQWPSHFYGLWNMAPLDLCRGQALIMYLEKVKIYN